MTSKSAVSPRARPIPAAIPMAEASTPIASDSTTTERSTWRLLAPSVRSVASSRVRWAIVIESVLKITNAPTKSAIPPKPSRKPRMNERNEFTFFWSALACSSAVLTWTLPGTAERSSRTSRSFETPGFAATEMAVKPFSSSMACAVGIVNTAIVAPPRLSTSPYFAMPLIRKRCFGPFAAASMKSPTAKWCVLAVFESITTSCAAPSPASRHQVQRIEAGLRGIDPEAERRVAVRVDRIAVAVDQLRVRGVVVEVDDRAGGGPDLRQRADLHRAGPARSSPLPLFE